MEPALNVGPTKCDPDGVGSTFRVAWRGMGVADHQRARAMCAEPPLMPRGPGALLAHAT